jgi:CsoR family transcriptional regulator, copper-sensing transcriptional repressor
MDVNKKGAKHRLQIVHGHVGKIIEMVDSGAYCIDVIHQIQAVRSALKRTEDEILKNHLQTCVMEQIKEGKSEQVVEEIMKVVEKHE